MINPTYDLWVIILSQKTRLRLSLDTHNGVKPSEHLVLYQNGEAIDQPCVVKGSTDALERALSYFYNEIERQNTQWPLLDIAEFCHGLMDRLRRTYSSL